MKTVSISEVIKASSQKSIVTGKSGIGIRTMTKGLNAEWANKVAARTYDLPEVRQVTISQVTENPDVVKAFPRILEYQSMADDEGRTRYLVACTTYVGLDYGYFCGIGNYMRSGNCVSHVFVMDEKPSAGVLAALVTGDYFLPHDASCRPDNSELQRLLTGEPEWLAARELEVDDTLPAVDETSCWVAMAILQTKINHDLGKEDSLQRVVFKSVASRTPDMLRSLALLPDDLVCDMFFRTNLMVGSGMPSKCRMVFINEFLDDGFEASYNVFLNLDDLSQSKNIDTENYYFGKMMDAARKGDVSLFCQLADYLAHVTVTVSTDYKFIYDLFIATRTDRGLALADLTPEFFLKVKDANLAQESSLALKRTVNQALNQVLEQVNSQQDLYVEVMPVVSWLYVNMPEMLQLSERSLANITNEMFLEPRRNLNNYLGRYGLQTVLYVDTREVGDEDFYETIRPVADAEAWKALVQAHMADVEAHADDLISCILASSVADKSELVYHFFPKADPDDVLKTYAERHIDQMSHFTFLVHDLCLGKGRNMMLSMLQAGGYGDVTMRYVGEYALEYYRKLSDSDLTACIQDLYAFAQDAGLENFCRFNFAPVMELYAKQCGKAPKEANVSILTLFVHSPHMDKETRSVFETILTLRRKGKTNGTYRELIYANRMGLDVDTRLAIFRQWVAARENVIRPKDVVDYIKEGDQLPNYKEATKMIEAFFDNQRRWPEKDFASLVIAVTDTAEWTKKERQMFVENHRSNKGIADFFAKEFGLQRIIIRKLFKK